MSILNRFLLLFYTLGIMVALFAVGLAVAGWTNIINMFQLSLARDNDRLIIGSITVVFLIISIKFFLHALSNEKRPSQAVVHENSNGQVRVSAEAIVNMVCRVVNQIRGVREVNPRVSFKPEGIYLFIKVIFLPEINIPQTSDEIQDKVNNYMSEVAGITIKSIKILVENISSDIKSGAPRKLM